MDSGMPCIKERGGGTEKDKLYCRSRAKERACFCLIDRFEFYRTEYKLLPAYRNPERGSWEKSGWLAAMPQRLVCIGRMRDTWTLRILPCTLGHKGSFWEKDKLYRSGSYSEYMYIWLWIGWMRRGCFRKLSFVEWWRQDGDHCARRNPAEESWTRIEAINRQVNRLLKKN